MINLYKLSLVANVFFFFLVIVLIIRMNLNAVPKPLQTVYRNWDKFMIPPSLDDNIVVYASAPLFNLSENLYAVGLGGIVPEVQESLADVLCNLDKNELNSIVQLSQALNIDKYGIAGLLAREGWDAYIPARDGFPMAKFNSALQTSFANSQNIVKDSKQLELAMSYLTKGIYGNDVFGLGGVCNSCIFNGNGLQIDDGSATEVGMIGMRGMPMVIFRDQVTDQFGPGASNPMPLGNATSVITQRSYTVQDAIKLLKQKITDLRKNKSNPLVGYNYQSTVPPPLLVQFWLEVGAAVYLTRYREKKIYVDPVTGIQDVKKSCTDFYYQKFYVDGSADALSEIVLEIMRKVQQVEEKWFEILPIWAGCDKIPTLEELQTNPNVC